MDPVLSECSIKKKKKFQPANPLSLDFFYLSIFVQTVPPLRHEHTRYLNRLKNEVMFKDTHQWGQLFKP